MAAGMFDINYVHGLTGEIDKQSELIAKQESEIVRLQGKIDSLNAQLKEERETVVYWKDSSAYWCQALIDSQKEQKD